MNNFVEYTKQLNSKETKELANDLQAINLLQVFIKIFPGSKIVEYQNLRSSEPPNIHQDQLSFF